MTDDAPKSPTKPTDDRPVAVRTNRLSNPMAPIKNEPEPSRRTIGPYKILSTIGEGGMGAVYLAEQKKPFPRQVAVKLIKAGMDSRAIVARFESERQALALMDHPNIARILGAGTTDDGRPYFAMEYVKGIPLTEYCHKQKLLIRDRLDLFKQICLAVQHAHQKAIIHRDLKPENILVTDQHGQPAPKIIDFGLAKAIGGHRLTDQSFFTAQGVMMGTPEYMSPEQADPSALDIDTRTDVYSLGVILYRLLAGILPIEIKDLRAEAQIAALEAVRRKVCDEEPQKPSTRIGSSPDFGSQVAALRQIDRSGLMRKLKGDLDWITMKALEKDRNRRYATASDLVADIDRHLNHEPVSAGPPSQGYILKKFVRKNIGLVASLGVIFLAVAVGGVTATVFYLKSEEALQQKEAALQQKNAALQQKDAALQQKDTALQQKEAALTREEEARKDAEIRREEAEQQRKRAEKSEERERGERRKAEAAEQMAERAQSAIELQRNRMLQLSGDSDTLSWVSESEKLSELREEADRLWPSYPEQVETMETWLADTLELTVKLVEHQETLVELRKDAVLKSQGGEVGQSDDEENKTTARWKFADVETQWHHDILTDLVFGLNEFVNPDPRIGLIADVRERLVFARSVREETVERYDVEWEEAIASIANELECPDYQGLQITPQIGLVPIGRDPESGLWEFGHLQTGEIPDRDDQGKLELTRKTGLVFVLVPPGEFWIGAQKNDKDKPNYDPQAKPREGLNYLRLDPFFLSKYEMTQGQWERFTKENPSDFTIGGSPNLVQQRGLHPVEYVSWEKCDRILFELDLLLPTEAQWEYAARGGTTTAWWTGADRDSLIGAANLADQAAKRAGFQWESIKRWPKLDDGFPVHAPIGKYRANPFGLHDVHGNVSEWTVDTDPDSSTSVRKEESTPLPEPDHHRVYRGGSFRVNAGTARSAHRMNASRGFRHFSLGLRPRRSIDL